MSGFYRKKILEILETEDLGDKYLHLENEIEKLDFRVKEAMKNMRDADTNAEFKKEHKQFVDLVGRYNSLLRRRINFEEVVLDCKINYKRKK